MNAPRNFALATATALLSTFIFAFAAEPTAPSPGPSKEMRDKMAMAHERMAACLRSNKELADCQREMQQSCSSMMGEQGCPMMGNKPGRPRQQE